MNIAIDARFYRQSTAGLGRYTRALLHNLAKIDKKNQYTVFITPADDKEYNLNASNFTKKVINIGHYTIAEQTKFLSLLNKGNFDLVHFLNFNHPILYHRPFIVTIHDLTMLLFPVGRSQKSAIRKFAFNKVMKNAAARSTKIIAISEATKKDTIKHIGGKPKNIQVIYEGYDAIYHSQYTISKVNEIKNKYSLNKPYLLFVSQWRPHKGLPKLIKAFEIFKNKYQSDIQLVITGKPNKDFPDVIRAIRGAQSSDDIITPGFVDEKDLPLLYKGSQAFIFPSFYEGFGLGPLEAMACGTPVLSSNLSCMPEILGDAPLYFNPKNPNEIVNAIHKILSDPKLREQTISRSLTQSKKYSWSKMAHQTLKLYQKIKD